MNLLDAITDLDWITPLQGLIGQLARQRIDLGVPTAQWYDARDLLRRHRIGVYAVCYRSDKVVFNVQAGIGHLAWCILARAGFEMLGPCAPNPQRRKVYAARDLLFRRR